MFICYTCLNHLIAFRKISHSLYYFIKRMTTESLSGLVEQLSKEMKDCMKEIVPRVLLVETNTDSSTANNVPIHIREYVDVDEEERKELNAVRIRTSSFLQTARKMQVALEEIIISKRDKSEEETLKQVENFLSDR